MPKLYPTLVKIYVWSILYIYTPELTVEKEGWRRCDGEKDDILMEPSLLAQGCGDLELEL